jgi:hypothetical protein
LYWALDPQWASIVYVSVNARRADVLRIANFGTLVEPAGLPIVEL